MLQGLFKKQKLPETTKLKFNSFENCALAIETSDKQGHFSQASGITID